jgi:5-methylcytosine-specific restriction endonuclease McrA
MPYSWHNLCVASRHGKKSNDWKAEQVYHDAGHGFVECSRRFGFTYTAWIKAIQRKKLRVAPSAFQYRRRKYNWAEIQVYYDAGRSYRECRTKFKFCAASWTNAVRRGEIKPRRFGMPIAELLSSPKRNRKHVKSRLISAGLLQNSCQSCGLTEWREESLHMHLDHINGVKSDNRLENLRMLCPNCHSQTPTYGGRNLKRGGVARPGANGVV